MRNGPRPSSITRTNRWPLNASNGTSTDARPAGNAISGFSAGGPNATLVRGSLKTIFCTVDDLVELGIAARRVHVERDAHALDVAAVGVDLGARDLGLLLDQPLDDLVSTSIQNSNGRPPSGTIVTTSYLRPFASARSLYSIRARARSGYQNASRSRYAALTASSRAARAGLDLRLLASVLRPHLLAVDSRRHRPSVRCCSA